MIRMLVFFLWTISSLNIAASEELQTTILFEDFKNLSQWEDLFFPKIKQHSVYQTLKQEKLSVLRAFSDDSASAIVWKQRFSLEELSKLSWRWKVNKLHRDVSPKTKAGDDYPLRVYVLFEIDWDQISLWERAKYEAYKLKSGTYPPYASLNYVWSSSKVAEQIFSSPYTDRVKIIVLQQGKEHLGEWREESRNIRKDFQQAFGEQPPKTATLAIMSDSDNTGQSAEGFLDYIELR